MSKSFIEAVENRRSYRLIDRSSPVPDEEIISLVEKSVKYAPTAFNSQGARVVVLFGDNHDKLWEITREALRKIVPEANFGPTNEKIDTFKKGQGTILYYEDQAVVEGLQEKFALYKDNFPIWSLESSGMLQFIIWTALTEAGLGASLQHYNPLIDEQVRQEWNLPDKWLMLGQMPFGKPLETPEAKEFMPIENMVKILK